MDKGFIKFKDEYLALRQSIIDELVADFQNSLDKVVEKHRDVNLPLAETIFSAVMVVAQTLICCTAAAVEKDVVELEQDMLRFKHSLINTYSEIGDAGK